MSTPTGLLLAPPCHALAPRALGAFTITAQLASGRRADVYLGHRTDTPSAPLRLRVPRAGLDARAFVREAQRAIAWGGPGSISGVEELERGVVAWGAPVVGESLAVVLASLLTEGVPLPVELAITVSMGLAERLGKGPRRVHGDLAPHHVIIGYDGSVALIDPAGPEDAAERALAPGRLGYRSPEHVKGEPVGPASDVFVLGTLLYELTTATRLFGQATPREVEAAIVAGGYPRPRAVLGDHYPIELQVLLRKLLRAQPEGRFPDGDAALEGLRLAASIRAEGQTERVGEWMRARFRDRYRAWGQVLERLGVELMDEPLDFDGDPTEAPDLLDLDLPAPPAPAPSPAPWPVWSPPVAPARLPAPVAHSGLPAPRPSALPSPRPPQADIDLDEQTRPLSGVDVLSAPDRRETALELRAPAVDHTDPSARAAEDTLDEPAPLGRAAAASRERTVVSAPAPPLAEDPDERTWSEAQQDDPPATRRDAASVAWDLELPEDVDRTTDDGELPSLLDDADLELLSGSEDATPPPTGAVLADLAADLLGEDFRERPSQPPASPRQDRAIPEPRKVRQRQDSALLDPSAAPTQLGAAVPPPVTRPAAPTATLEPPTPVRPAPTPPRREQTMIVRQRVIPRDGQPEVTTSAQAAPEATQPLVATLGLAEVSDADADELVIPVADDDGARGRPTPSRTALYVSLAAVAVVVLAAVAWILLDGTASPAPAPIPTVRAVPAPPSPEPPVAPAPTTATTAATSTATWLEPEPEPDVESATTAALPVAPDEPAPEPEAEPEAEPTRAAQATGASASPRASARPALRRRPSVAPTPKGPTEVKVTVFPANATLRVAGRALPAGARVVVGEEPVVVTVSAEGYQEQMVELRAGQRTEIWVVLRRKR